MDHDADTLAPVERTDPFSRKHASQCWYSHKADTIWIDTPAVEDHLEDIARHELDHFLLHSSTPYGHLLDELGLRQTNLSCLLLFQYEHDLFCPVYDFAATVLRNPAGSALYPAIVQPLLNGVGFSVGVRG